MRRQYGKASRGAPQEVTAPPEMPASALAQHAEPTLAELSAMALAQFLEEDLQKGGLGAGEKRRRAAGASNSFSFGADGDSDGENEDDDDDCARRSATSGQSFAGQHEPAKRSAHGVSASTLRAAGRSKAVLEELNYHIVSP